MEEQLLAWFREHGRDLPWRRTRDPYAIQAFGPIHIIVKNGHVSLKGVVASETQRRIATILARGRPFAVSVDNELTL